MDSTSGVVIVSWRANDMYWTKKRKRERERPAGDGGG